jgi:serine/threonine-protein kinase
VIQDDDLGARAGVREGELLAGKYRVERVLGVGGMGVVVAAHHLELDTPVAVKFVLPALLGEGDALARFAREARAAAKITNEHVARVFDVGTLENGAPYMVMEFLQGEDLGQWIQRRGPLPVDQAVEFVLQACVAVAEAHSLGIVHRDLKPSNLFCVRRSDGQLLIKVLDFGISKISAGGHAQDARLTRTTAVMGSPAYMSPEQVQNAKDIDTRTDVWSLGVVLFELISAQQPFPGETLAEVAVKIAMAEPASLGRVRPDAASAVETVVRRCLEKDRARRYGSVAALARALLPFAASRGGALVDRVLGIAGAGSAMSGAGADAAIEWPAGASPATGSPRTLTAVQDWGRARSSGPGGVGGRGRAAVIVSSTAMAIIALAVGVMKLRHVEADPVAVASGTRSAFQAPPPFPSDESVRLAAAPDPWKVATAPRPRASAVATPPPVVKSAGESTRGAPLAAPVAAAPPGAPVGIPLPVAPTVQFEDSGAADVPSGKTALLTINSIPPSLCFLDGELLGATPRVQLPVTPGPHVVKFLEVGGPLSKTLSVVAAAGETTYATAKLEDPVVASTDGGT